MGAGILNASIPFILLPILTRVLTPADYGVVAMFFLAQGVFAAFSGLSVQGAIAVRYFQLASSELANYIGACIRILLISTTALALLILAFGDWLVKLTGVPLVWLTVAVIISGCQFLINIQLALWQVTGKAIKYGFFQVSQTFFNMTISLLLVLYWEMAWKGRVLGHSVVVIFFGALSLLLLYKGSLLSFSRDWRIHAINAMKFGVPLIPHVIGGLLIIAADRLIIVRLLDLTQAGIYMVALQIGQCIGLITDCFNKAYAPWLINNLSKSNEFFRIKVVRFTYLYFFIVSILAAGLGILSQLLLQYFVGKSFQEAGDLVLYTAFGFAFGGCYFMVTNYIFFENKTKFLALVTLVSGLVNIPLMFILVSNNGIIGAGQAFMLTNLISFLGTWLLAHKTHPMPWWRAISP